MTPRFSAISRAGRSHSGVCGVATALCLVIVHWDFAPLVNLLGAAPLVFALPGWAIMLALGVRPKGWIESAVLTATISLAVVVLAGLCLNLSSDITRSGWLAALGTVTLLACVASLAVAAPVHLTGLSTTGEAGETGAWYRVGTAAMFAAAAGLVAVAIATAALGAARHREFYYTQLWIVPKEDAPDEVVIGLRSAERGEESYAIDLLVDHRLVQTWSNVTLKEGETWTTAFRWAGLGMYPRAREPTQQSTPNANESLDPILRRTALGAMPRVEALVYRANNRAAIYRWVWTAPQCFTDDSARGRPPCAS